MYKTALVSRCRIMPNGYLELVLRDREIANSARPGQFAMIKGWQGADPILLRPFDIVDTEPDTGDVLLVVKITGRGTSLLRGLAPGAAVVINGPLGKGVDDFRCSSLGLLVRGVGAAAVVFLAKEAKRRGVGVYGFLSAATARRLVCREELTAACDRLWIATDDGSEGYHGNAIDMVERQMRHEAIDRLYTCGSKRFARYVKSLSTRGAVEGYVFLESPIACGLGHCHGCAVPREGRGDYLLICRDGPVFPAAEIVL
jgi:dihydroorotate dehydrogenase electron transfer subunit